VPTLLALDTAGDTCTLALMRDGAVDLAGGLPGQNHLEHVMPMIEQLLQRNGLEPEDCDAFAFGSGPGAFTGLRVACTIAQGLAFGAGRPVIAVGNLPALARRAARQAASPAPCRVLAVIDARLNQVYWSVLDVADGICTERAPASLCDAAQLADIALQWQPQLCAGRAPSLPALAGQGGWEVCEAVAGAGDIVQMAARSLARGEVLQADRAAPLYVRDQVARTVQQRRAGAAAADAA